MPEIYRGFGNLQKVKTYCGSGRTYESAGYDIGRIVKSQDDPRDRYEQGERPNDECGGGVVAGQNDAARDRVQRMVLGS